MQPVDIGTGAFGGIKFSAIFCANRPIVVCIEITVAVRVAVSEAVLAESVLTAGDGGGTPGTES